MCQQKHSICNLFTLGCSTNAFGRIYVGDVVDAHIAVSIFLIIFVLFWLQAAENPAASGRYIVSSAEPMSTLELCQILKKHFPTYPIPTFENPTLPKATAAVRMSTAKLEVLNFCSLSNNNSISHDYDEIRCPRSGSV